MTERTERAATDRHAGSGERFGYSWDRFRELTPEQEAQFRRWTAPLDPERDWRGRTFLDVGCGMGRNSVWAMKYGAAGGLAIDIDTRSLAAARANLEAYPGVEVAECSIYDLDAPDRFDIAFSIGVIHHLPDPARALASMRDAVKPGGQVLIWVYGCENIELYVRVLNPLRWLLFSRLPLALVRRLAYVPATLLWLGLRMGLGRIEYFNLLRAFPFRHLHHIVFDQMLPRIAHYWRREEVEALMRDAGLVDVRLQWINQMSWAAVGRRAD
jgi:SAM-dependent methyltransferase